ncbi:type II secretion system protein [Neptuniibacter pectenicola]|uniref:type II secretion system protein n=1 Tax=Neptuniibacter pectenicola TaxID=1806669 RepID=UPI0009ED592C|nr:type II secretion system protein [Neptuniibacter pectenicola]
MSTLMPTLSINNDPRCTQFKQQGFTLLELVLVMLIIGLIASTPLAFIDNQDNQLRYDETVAKMKLIKRAVYNQSTYQNQPLLSGFVVDNGVLPPTSGTPSQDPSELFPLIGKNDVWNLDGANDWDTFGGIKPYLKLTGAGDFEVPPRYTQLKGYRGPYLQEGVDSDGAFLDGWGVGFEVSSTAVGDYRFTYTGDDGSHPAPFNTLVSGAVSSLDWQVPLSQLNINVTNYKLTAQEVAIAVFQNKAASDDERWTTYYFSIAAASGGVPSIERTLTFSSSEWQKKGVGSISNPETTYIPAGQHPIFVVDSGSVVNAYDRLLVIPRSTQPALQLEVK